MSYVSQQFRRNNVTAAFYSFSVAIATVPKKITTDKYIMF